MNILIVDSNKDDITLLTGAGIVLIHCYSEVL